MTRASLSRLTTSGTTGTAALELIAGAARGFYLRELTLTQVAATASIFGAGRPAAKGTTPTTPVFFQEENQFGLTTSTASTALAWGAGPTVPAVFYRQNQMPATVGAALQWLFGSLWVPAGSTFVLWNGGTNSVVQVNAVIDEG
jgi:hypothetical protein